MLDQQVIIKEFNAKLRQHQVEKNNFDINVLYPPFMQGEKIKKNNPRNDF
jgi:hypothetical protein